MQGRLNKKKQIQVFRIWRKAELKVVTGFAKV
jgi:hypothetical protein